MSNPITSRLSDRPSDVPPPVTKKEYHSLSTEERRAYFNRHDFEASHGAVLDAVYTVLDGIGECSSPCPVDFYEDKDGQSMVRRPEGARAWQADILLNTLRFDLRGDSFGNAAEALRQLAAELEVAAEKIEAARDA